MDRPTVENWLRTLFLGQYSESFLDNGYDELEICKQIGEQDLDAVGVFNPTHRFKILEAVRKLREEGATAVYFTVEEVLKSAECRCGGPDRHARLAGSQAPRYTAQRACQLCAAGSESASVCGSPAEPRTPLPELKRLPSARLRQMLQNKLVIDGIKLYNPPYSTKDGQMGYLNGLASRYADDVQTHYQDVLRQLDVLRVRAWHQLVQGDPRHAPPATLPPADQPPPLPLPQSQPQPDITQSVQPIYQPGQYLPSSCLSDHDEDEIYGFGYGVYDPRGGSDQQHRAGSRSRSPTYGVPLSCAVDVGRTTVTNGALPPPGHARKKRGRLGKLFRTLKINRQRNFPKLARSKGGRMLAGGSGPVLLPPSSLYAPSGSIYRAQMSQMSPSRSLEEGVQMFKELERERLQQRRLQEAGDALRLRDLRSGQREEESSPSGGATGGNSLYGQSGGCGGGGGTGRSAWFDDTGADSDSEEYLLRSTEESPRDQLVPASPARRQHDHDVVSLRTAGDISLLRWAPVATTSSSDVVMSARRIPTPTSSQLTTVPAQPPTPTPTPARSVLVPATVSSEAASRAAVASAAPAIADPRYYQNIGYVMSGSGSETRRSLGVASASQAQAQSALLSGVAALSLRSSPQVAGAGR